MYEAELDRFFAEYYRWGSPDRAAEALQYFVNSDILDKSAARGGVNLVPYFFARIAEDSPAVIRDFEAIFDKATPRGRVFILSVLEMVGDERTQTFLNKRFYDDAYKSLRKAIKETLGRLPVTDKINALQRDIRGPFDLDLLWIEFCITGSKQAVRRIIQTLKWRDVVREKLQAWLVSERAPGLFGRSESRRKRTLDRLREVAGIECDAERQEVKTLEDLDCLCSLEREHRSPDRFQRVGAALPFNLSAEELNHIWVKASAKWSLVTNASRHELVLEACQEQTAAKEKRAELALLQIAARAYLSRDDNANAKERIEAYIERNPSHREMEQELRIVESRLEVDRGDTEPEEPIKKYVDIPPGLPSQAMVPGVPFISFEESNSWEYPDSSITNASRPASMGMIWKYWGQDVATFLDEEYDPADSDWVWEGGQANSVHVLKPFICKGIPVYVSGTAFTPYAHPIIHEYGELSGFTFENEGPFSGALGRMLSLAKIQELEGKVSGVTMMETVFISDRVIIGYDDERSVLILHDPTFGPTWQVSYDDFEKMWEPNGRGFLALHPPNYEEVVAERLSSPPYPNRHPNDEASVHFVFAYALSSCGRASEAENHLRQGLAIPELEKGYRYLLLHELAVHHRANGRTDDAIVAAEEATKLVPGHHMNWALLNRLYRQQFPEYHHGFSEALLHLYKKIFVRGWERKAAIAGMKAKARAERSREIVRERLPRRFSYSWEFFGESGLRFMEADN